MTKKYRTAAQAGGAASTAAVGASRHRVAAAAMLAVGGLVFAANASALALGRMTVQSALGEPLRAEIDVPEITDLEADTLVLQPASAAAFRAAGVEYSPAMAGLQLSLARRTDGRSVVRVSGSRPVNDPFLEMLLEANWNGGRISRNYTVLLDPPSNRATAAAPQIAPQIAAAQQLPAAPPVAARAVPTPLPAAVPAPAPAPAPIAERPPAAPRAPAVAAEPRPSTGTSQVTVRPGDTAGRIAAANKPASVSLDQMLVALLQANPDAFVGNNVNRMRAGVVLDVPDAAQIAATPAPQARQIVVAQSRDFNEFRRRLAGRAPAADVGTPQRAVTGSVQTQVEDRRAAAATPDRLTLSKGTTGTEADRVAQAGNSRDAANRSAELSKNLDDLNRLGAATTSGAAPATPAITAPAVPAAPVPAPAAAAPPAPAADASAPVPAAAAPAVETPAAPTPADAAAAKAPAAAPATPATAAPAAAPVAEDEDGLGSLLQDSRVLAVAGLLVALIVALASYRTVRRRRAAQDSSFLESRMHADSFFGNSGGQHVDTSSTQSVIATSYSPSQLDAGGDVDPVAEADVYLAYGRDLQAEEILKEALRIHPERTALHAKLAEIYARRADAPAFHNIAAEAYRITDGRGEDWMRIRALGQELAPANSLYQAQPTLSGAAPAVVATAAGVGAAAAVAAFADNPQAEVAPPAPAPAPVEPQEPAPFVEDVPEPVAASVMPSLDLDFSEFPSSPRTPAAPAAAPAADDDFGLDFTLDDPAPSSAAAAPAASPPPSPSTVDFDLDALSLDLDTPAEAPPVPADITGSVPSPEDALATKLALAEEFAAIGDADGARHLVEEVIAEAKGSLRTRAEGMLAELG
ncbi:FimV/HubP family polar landmark protein [Sphingomonas sp. NCPPB 2930]